MDADPSHITVVQSLDGRAALVDRDGVIVHGPCDPRDDSDWRDLTAWLRGYLLDQD